MRIGIIADLDLSYVGQYHYTINLIELLKVFGNTNHEYFVFTNNKQISDIIPENTNWHKVFYDRNGRKIFNSLLLGRLSLELFLPFKFGFKNIRKYNIDLLIQPTVTTVEGYSTNIPYIVCVHDLMQEYYKHGLKDFSFKVRLIKNFIEKKVSKNAIMTIVDSEQGKEDLMKFYGMPKDKIKIIPYIPPLYIFKNKDLSQEQINKILERFNLPSNYVFYPAQLFYQKNHIRLLEAINLIKEKYGVEIPLVLVGPPNNAYNDIKTLINRLKLNSQVLYLGCVGETEIVALYKKATALVFPSFFGPTNIPIFEAMILGTPIVCSNLFEMPKQTGDAALLFNPFETKDIAEKIYIIWTNSELRKNLIVSGFKKAEYLNYDYFGLLWKGAIEEVCMKI